MFFTIENFDILRITFVWFASFVALVLLFKPYLSSALDPLVASIFYLSSLLPIPLEYLITEQQFILYPFLCILIILTALLCLYTFASLRLIRLFPSTLDFQGPALGYFMSKDLYILFLFSLIASLLINSIELSNLISGHLFDRYRVLLSGRNVILTLFSPCLALLPLFAVLRILSWRRLISIRISNVSYKYLDILLSLGLFLFLLNSFLGLLNGSRSALFGLFVSLGTSFSFFSWISPSLAVKRYGRLVLVFVVFGACSSIVMQSLFTSSVLGHTFLDEFESAVSTMFTRLFANSDNVFYMQEARAYYLFNDANPLRFILGPFAGLVGIKNAQSFGNILFNLVGTTEFNSGSNFNILSYSFVFGYFFAPIFCFLAAFGSSLMRFFALKNLDSPGFFILKPRIIAQYLLYTNSFSIFEDVEFFVFKMMVNLIFITSGFILFLVFKSLTRVA